MYALKSELKSTTKRGQNNKQFSYFFNKKNICFPAYFGLEQVIIDGTNCNIFASFLGEYFHLFSLFLSQPKNYTITQ